MVLIGHCIPPFFPFHEYYVPLKRFLSQVGVNLFLILSGFGVAYTYFQSYFRSWNFLQRRIITLWPLYAFAMAFYTILSFLVFRETITMTDLFTNLFWVQVFFNTQNQIYSASHFFSALFIAYLLASLALLGNKKSNRLVIYQLAMGTFQAICFWYYGRLFFVDYLASFSLGIAIWLISQNGLNRSLMIFLSFSYIYCLFDVDDFLTASVTIVIFLLV